MILFGFGIIATLLFTQGVQEDSVRLIIRWTAKISGILFLAAFSASSIHYFTKSRISKSLVASRPKLGLAFAVSHTFHLAFLILLQQQIHPVFTLADKTSLTGGFIAYLFLYAMAITTFPSFKAKLSSKNWRGLHLVGSYWIWFIFFNSYFNSAMNRERYYLLFALFVAGFLLRKLQYIHQKWIGSSTK